MTLLYYFKPHYLTPQESTGAGQGPGGAEKRRYNPTHYFGKRPKYSILKRKERIKKLEKKLAEISHEAGVVAEEIQLSLDAARRVDPELSLLLVQFWTVKLELLRNEVDPLFLRLQQKIQKQNELLKALQSGVAYIENEALLQLHRTLREEEELMLLALLMDDSDD